jgi:OOP family OmpA-OmpF porin
MKTFLVFLICCFVPMLLMAQDQGEPVYIHSIYFGGGDYRIDSGQIQDLHDFIDAIPNLGEYEISVHGYTDDIGGIEYNQWLSGMRSEMVIRQLMFKNIPREVIAIKDFGELNPIYDNSTWEGKLKNRRCDVILKKIVM